MSTSQSPPQQQHTLSAFSYGKDDVRILRIVRDQDHPASHQVVEYRIQCLLSGSSFSTSYTQADNRMIVATDSIKNTLNLLAKRTIGWQILIPEMFALVIVQHFLQTYQHIENVHLEIDQLKWSRITLHNQSINGRSASSSGLASTSTFDPSKQHPHSFVRDGNEKRFVRAIGKRNSSGQPSIDILQSGIRDLVVLKSSGSAFYGFWRDEYTTLPEVQDRIFSTSVECQYDIKLPPKPLQDLLDPSFSDLPSFDTIAQNAVSHILTTFATHSSPSVQATMFQTGQAILNDNEAKSVIRVDLQMPNRHYIPIDLSWAKEENLKEDQAEVFLPSEHPSGLIKATVTRSG